MSINYNYKKKINNEGIKRKRAKNSRQRFAGVFLLGICLVLGMIFSGWVRWKQTEIIYRINKVDERISITKEDQKEMLLELYQLQSFERTRVIAEKQLGMVEVEPEQIIIIEVERHEGKEPQPQAEETPSSGSQAGAGS